MAVDIIGGIKVLRLRNGQCRVSQQEDMAMLRIWQMLTGGHACVTAS